MRGVLLFISVAVFMIFGFFAVRIADEFFTENYKGFNYDECQEKENVTQNNKNQDEALFLNRKYVIITLKAMRETAHTQLSC